MIKLCIWLYICILIVHCYRIPLKFNNNAVNNKLKLLNSLKTIDTERNITTINKEINNLIISQELLRDYNIIVNKLYDTIEDAVLHLRRNFKQNNNFKLQSDETNTIKITNKPRIIVIGSGWSAHALLKIIETDIYDVICVSPRPYFIFTPMLASSAVGTVEFRSIVEPIRSSNPLIRYFECEVIDFNPQLKNIIVNNQLDQRYHSSTNIIEYDYLVYAAGATVNTFGLNNVTKYCDFIKEIDDVKLIKKKIVDLFELSSQPNVLEKDIKRLLTFVVVGGGPTGVEFAGELHDLVVDELSKLFPYLLPYVKIILINSGSSLLSTFDSVLQEKALASLQAEGVVIKLNTRVTNINSDTLTYKSNNDDSSTDIGYGVCVWAAGTATRPITKQLITKLNSLLQNESLKKTGKLQVDKWLRVDGLEDNISGSIIAMGDVANVVDGEAAQLPQTAQVAAQQGAYVARLFNRGYNVTSSPPTITLTSNNSFSDWINNNIQSLRVRGKIEATPFTFLNLGSLAYVGGQEAVAEVKLGELDILKAYGNSAFVLWRSVYLVKQVSVRTRVLVLFDFIKSKIFGRDLTNV